LAAIDANEGCAPLDLLIANNSVNATSYRWHFWDGTTSTQQNIPAFSALAAGDYQVTLTAYNPLTCNDSSVATATFSVFGKPAVYFTTGDTSYLMHENILFNNQSDPGSYLWAFGDDSTSTQVDSVVHAYGLEGVYYPCLTVTSENGCDSTYCSKLRI